MDNEMIKRCAKAILDNDLADSSYDRIHPDDAKRYAIAAIKAMREPTEKMIGAGFTRVKTFTGAVNCYQDMIDSIINE